VPSSSTYGAVLLAVPLVACSKAQPSPVPAPPSASATASAISSAVSGVAPNVQSGLDICKRIAARGAVKNCQWPDAGIAVQFDVVSSGQGSVLVAPTAEGYQRMSGAKPFIGGIHTATSASARALVFWSGGDDATATAIKATLAELDAK
jgi:hypothetical protein